MEQPQTDLTGGRAIHQMVVRPGVIENSSEFICFVALNVMLFVVVVDIITRVVFNFSLEISDEIGGYMLVIMTFCSLSICHVSECFHRMELVLGRFSTRGRLTALIVFDLIALSFSITLTWQFIRLVRNSIRLGEDSGTLLMTPLWFPRLALAIGAAAVCYSICRTILARIRMLRGQSGGAAR